MSRGINISVLFCVYAANDADAADDFFDKTAIDEVERFEKEKNSCMKVI
jgi:hypothetical protein